MASGGQFHLFPPPPPKMKTAVESNPFRRAAQSECAVQAASFQLQTLVKSPTAEAVVIKITESPRDIQPLPRAHLPPPKEANSTVDLDQNTLSNGQPTNQATQGGSSCSTPFLFSRPAPASGSPAPALSAARSPSPNPIQNSVAPSPSPNSPMAPMRSMFPIFNPNLPLSQQQYYPQRETSLQWQVTSREEYSPRVRCPSQLDQVLGGVKTAPSSVIDFPMDDAVAQRSPISSCPDLEKLWQATNGQEPDAVLPSFNLKMSRVEPTTFTFGAPPSLPFYSLQTYSTSELAIHRTNPRKPAVKIPILLLSLEPEARRSPPNDGLVAYIFPKLAAMLAIDQSNELAAEHGLAPTHQDEMQGEAVARAAAQESCRLRWNETGRRYELAHPAIGRDANRGPRFAQSPAVPSDEGESPVLHITVSSHALSSPRSCTSTPPVILVTNPDRSSVAWSAPSHTRVSTLPVHESNEPLASLDFRTMSLHISARAILQLMPSLYAIDSVVSAIFAVAVADSATNPIMAEMDLWSGRLAPPVAGSVFGGGSVAGRSYAGSALYATLAEREEAEQEANLMKQLHDKDTKSKLKNTDKKKASFWGRKPRPVKSKSKQILVTEFDIEKLCHYQSGDREGQKLPGLATSLIQGMVLALQFVVWSLTALVRILTWIVVGATRALTSEKF